MKIFIWVLLIAFAPTFEESKAIACGGGREVDELICDTHLDDPFPQQHISLRFELWTLASAYMPSYGVTPAGLLGRPHSDRPETGTFEEFKKKVAEIATRLGKPMPTLVLR